MPILDDLRREIQRDWARHGLSLVRSNIGGNSMQSAMQRDLIEIIYARVGHGNHEEAEQMHERWFRQPAFRLAWQLVAEGFSVFPLREKRPARKWKPYQERLPSVAELVEWFADNDYSVAIVTGTISGITVIDCDSAEAISYCPVRSNVMQRTKRGRHYIFRHDGERNTVRLNGVSGIDRRGEGGYVVAYPDSAAWTRKAINHAPTLAN